MSLLVCMSEVSVIVGLYVSSACLSLFVCLKCLSLLVFMSEVSVFVGFYV